MSFVINGIEIKEKDDYLEKGARSRVNSTMRSDLFDDYKKLMKHLKLPMSVGQDVFIEMLQEDPKLLKKFMQKCRDY